MHIHHAYIGIVLILWSTAVIWTGALMIGEFKPWLAWGGLLLGVGLLVHDVLSHAKKREKR